MRYKKFAEGLKKAIAENQMTIEEVAEKAGFSASTIKLYIKGESNPSAITIERLSDVLECPVSRLFGEDTKSNASKGLTVEDIQRIQYEVLAEYTSAFELNAEERAEMLLWIEGVKEMTWAVIRELKGKQVENE